MIDSEKIKAALALHRKLCDNPDDDCGCICGNSDHPCPTRRALLGHADTPTNSSNYCAKE